MSNFKHLTAFNLIFIELYVIYLLDQVTSIVMQYAHLGARCLTGEVRTFYSP